MLAVDPRIPRVALVTGGAKRLGRAMVEALAEDGWAVAVHCHRSRAEADALVAELVGRGSRAAVFVADLSDAQAVQSLMPRVVEVFGPVGLLINNASTFEMDTIQTATAESWDFHIQPNLQAPFVLSQAFAKQLPKDAQGVVLNMLDQRVWNLTPYFATYTVSKAGLWTLTQTLALALAPRVRVCGIGPGPAMPSPRQTDAEFSRQCRSTPLQHGTTPEEIAMTMRFILAARSLTGQMIALDGGQHLGWSPEHKVPAPLE